VHPGCQLAERNYIKTKVISFVINVFQHCCTYYGSKDVVEHGAEEEYINLREWQL
jgi:uncharacterized protein YbcV (DUF1398 family)